MRHILSMLLLWAGAPLPAQWVEPFDSSLQFSWIGDRQHFFINEENQLQLQAPMAGSSSLWRPCIRSDSMYWSFSFYLDFSPSNANRLTIYLVSQEPQPHSNTAIWLEIGENGNQDRWSLFKRSKGIEQEVKSGTAGKFGIDPVKARFSIQRIANDQWSVYADDPETGLLIDSAYFQLDEMIGDSFYFGIQCFYTETRKQAFRFDDFAVQSRPQGPVISNHEFLEPNVLKLQWNKPIHLDRSNPSALFSIQPYTRIDSTQWTSSNICLLYFDSPLLDGEWYVIKYHGFIDYMGNEQQDGQYAFKTNIIHEPAYNDLIISEIMADPSPPIFLPDAEYIEIFNRSTKKISLMGCTLSDGSSDAELPDSIMYPGEYRIVCKLSDAQYFSKYGKIIPLSIFPSINNDGDEITLYNRKNEQLTVAVFSLEDYKDAQKAMGGYALEYIALNRPCLIKNEWHPSMHPSGGTPGVMNSVIDFSADLKGPQLLSATALSEWEIKLVFDEKIQSDLIYRPEQFAIHPSRSIATAEPQDSYAEWVLLLHQPLQEGTKYHLTGHGISDCLLNPSNIQSDSFALSSLPDSGDLVFSEVLFDAFSYHHEFIEIYNRSSKDLLLTGLEVSIGDTSDAWISLKESLKDEVLQAHQYLAISPDAEDLCFVYTQCDSNRVLSTPWKSMEDNGDLIRLAYNTGRTRIHLDSLPFSSNWHHPFELDTEGKSLEKLDFDEASYRSSNWQTASKKAGFATPGLPNSQRYIERLPNKDFPYQLSGNRLSPNGDGFEDVLNISIQAAISGLLSRIQIFSLTGVPIAELYKDRVDYQQRIVWYGQDRNGLPLPYGNYILSLYFKHPEGEESAFKERIAIIP